MCANVAFETKVWEGDWEFILRPDRISRVITRNLFQFSSRTIYVNNVVKLGRVIDKANLLVKSGLIDQVVVAEEHLDCALTSFGLTRASLGRGLVYSACEFVGLHLCKAEFLTHFSGDTCLDSRSGWIDSAIDDMKNDNRLVVANPVWDKKYREAKAESVSEDERQYVGYGFSDQCYLIRPKVLRSADFTTTHLDSERYPAYGGELFEKRVDSWMRNSGLLRSTRKGASYISRNWPRREPIRSIFKIGEAFGFETEKWRKPRWLPRRQKWLLR